MTFHPEVLAEKISGEISGLSAKRERILREAQANGSVGEKRVSLHLMDQAMHFARRACEERCPVGMLMWLRALEDFR